MLIEGQTTDHDPQVRVEGGAPYPSHQPRQRFGLVEGADGDAHYREPLPRQQRNDIRLGRTGRVPDIPARPAQELTDQLGAEDMLLTGHRDAQCTRPRRQHRLRIIHAAQIGAELVRKILQAMQGHRDFDEITALGRPQLAEVPGRGREQIEVDGIGRDAGGVQVAHECGGFVGASLQHDAGEPHHLRLRGTDGLGGGLAGRRHRLGGRRMGEQQPRDDLGLDGAQQQPMLHGTRQTLDGFRRHNEPSSIRTAVCGLQPARWKPPDATLA